MATIKNGTIPFPSTGMDYIRFGSGKRNLILLPGLGDGLRSVKGTALPMAMMYRIFSREFTVYGFSRKHDMPEGSTTRDMARDVKQAMDFLGIEKADIFGVSMGGMIAQHLAIDYSERVGKLVLAVTAAKSNPSITDCIRQWTAQAIQDDHTALMDSNLRLIYSDDYYQKNKRLIPVIGRLTKPKSYDRFLIQADACLTHDAWEALPRINAPTLVIGGGQDKVVGSDAAPEIAERISGAKLKIYPKWGHSVYEEEPEFNQTVLDFLK